MEPITSLARSQQPATSSYPEADQSRKSPASSFQVIPFHQVSTPKSCTHLFSPTYQPPAPPISFYFIWSLA